MDRIYVVRDQAGKQRLVETNSPGQALKHVARSLFTVEVAGQQELVRLMRAGVAIETPGAEPPTGQASGGQSGSGSPDAPPAGPGDKPEPPAGPPAGAAAAPPAPPAGDAQPPAFPLAAAPQGMTSSTVPWLTGGAAAGAPVGLAVAG